MVIKDDITAPLTENYSPEDFIHLVKEKKLKPQQMHACQRKINTKINDKSDHNYNKKYEKATVRS